MILIVKTIIILYYKCLIKKNKDSITINQDKKIKAIIITSIKPYLQEKLKYKIKQNV